MVLLVYMHCIKSMIKYTISFIFITCLLYSQVAGVGVGPPFTQYAGFSGSAEELEHYTRTAIMDEINALGQDSYENGATFAADTFQYSHPVNGAYNIVDGIYHNNEYTLTDFTTWTGVTQ